MKLVAFAVASLVFGSSTFAADCAVPTSAQIIEAAVATVPQGESVTSVALKNESATGADVMIVTASSTLSLKVSQNCATNQLEVAPDANPNHYVCQTSYVDCMPRGGENTGPDYCSADFQKWSIANCGGAPAIVY